MPKNIDPFMLSDFKGLSIKLANEETIKGWSYGEVKKPETINYRTLRAEKDGLFDERIFGPTKDWECYCGKYKRIRYRGIVCDKCGVEVTLSRVRRERMGHISLSTPVAHVWFFKGAPSKLSLLLDISPRNLESVIYFSQYLVTNVDSKLREDVLKKITKKIEEKISEYQKMLKEKENEIIKDVSDKKSELKKKLKRKEELEIAISELDLSQKQRIATLRESSVAEIEKIKEHEETLLDSAKNIDKLAVISEEEYMRFVEYEAANFFSVGMGAQAVLEVLKGISLSALGASLRENSEKATGQKKIKSLKRLRIIESMKKANIDPTWMVLTVLPVIPPDLRPMVQLTGGRFATSDLNDLYRRVINRNSRLKHLIDLGAPEIILRNEKRMLQEAVDSLIDSSQRPTTRVVSNPLKSLSDILRGKQGRFRQNLLGKRVDYSGRSVIIVGPELKLNQCGLPKEMALEMFKPFVLREVIARGLSPNVKSAKRYVERRTPEVFDILEEITADHPVLLNRAPTLHKLSIQAFYPILIEGSAIRIHPCVCTGYNADFDGDQMAVHIPLSSKAKEEAINLMMPNHNLLKPADGSPITLPSGKDMAVGCFYLTSLRSDNKNENEGVKVEETTFSSKDEAILAFSLKKVIVREKIKVSINGEIIETSIGRILFNEVLPDQFPFINEPVKASTIKRIITQSFTLYDTNVVTKLVDDIKELGFMGATISGISVSVFDNEMVPEKDKFIQEAEKKVEEIEKNYQKGLITSEEKKRLSNDIWLDTTDAIADLTWKALKPENPVKMIIDSEGARAGKDQLKQLSAMRGLVVDPLGKIVELPTKSNFRQGLSVFEYVTSARGSRKGLTDSALKTADAGYLTRRLVDVAHDVIVREEDCETEEGIEFKKTLGKAKLEEKVIGRIIASDVFKKRSKKPVLSAGTEITVDNVKLLANPDVEEAWVRSPLTCRTVYGICRACYGLDLSTKKMVEIGVPVGVVAAQSIGEPGTQLTMRVRHFGGVVMADVTQGLPRVEELFESRTPKISSPLSEISGKVEVTETNEGYKISVRSVNLKPVEEREYLIPLTATLKVKDGDQVLSGMQLTEGSLDIKNVLEVRGLRQAQRYLISEIQSVYESQGIPINDKHFETIVRKMSDKVMIDSSGDTVFIEGELVDKSRFSAENAQILATGGEPATAHQVILGITRASLFTESWLSAASFQETTQVLTDAALFGKEDKLSGLKENVIIGRLIPTSIDRVKVEE